MYNINDKSAAIIRVQEFLYTITSENKGIPCVYPDGIFGEETAKCVRDFQYGHGLPQTGRVDYETFTLIVEEYRKVVERNKRPKAVHILPSKLNSGEIAPGERSSVVTVIQAMLRVIAVMYDNFGDVEITGVYDEATEQAVMELQRTDGIEPSGVVDKKTWNALADAYEKYVDADM